MRTVRIALKWLWPRADRGDASTRVAIGLALGLVLVVAVYVGWEAVIRHGH